jgi:hypothetical protein
MQVDAIDPPYGKEVVAKSCLKRRMTDTSVQSATSVVIGVDVGSGFTKGMPRSSKKNPEVILEHLINMWTQRWGNLKLVTADKEFITAKTLRMCEAFASNRRHRMNMTKGTVVWRWRHDTYRRLDR